MGTEQGDTAQLGSFSTKQLPASWLKSHKGVTKNVGLNSKKASAYGDQFNDPLWKKQWYVVSKSIVIQQKCLIKFDKTEVLTKHNFSSIKIINTLIDVVHFS